MLAVANQQLYGWRLTLDLKGQLPSNEQLQQYRLSLKSLPQQAAFGLHQVRERQSPYLHCFVNQDADESICDANATKSAQQLMVLLDLNQSQRSYGYDIELFSNARFGCRGDLL